MLLDQARCGEFFGYLSGQEGAILPALECLFCSCNKISPKSRWVYESFLSWNIFCDSKKILHVFSVKMELEKEKTESVIKNENKQN